MKAEVDDIVVLWPGVFCGLRASLMGEKSREPGAGEPGGSPGGAPKSRRSQSLILGGDRREEMMFEAHADIAIGADAKVIADEILDTLDEPALKRMASCHGLKTQVPGMSASGGRSTGGKERLKTILPSSHPKGRPAQGR